MAYLGFDETKTVRNETSVTATSGQTSFYPRGGYAKGYVDVYVDGTKKVLGTDFTTPDNITVLFASGQTVGAKVQMVTFAPVTISSVVSRSGDAMEGNLTIPNITISSNAVANQVTTQYLTVEKLATLANGANVAGGAQIAGDVTLTGNLNLTGSLIITGAATSVTTQSLSVEDTIIKLGANNSTDVLDIGIAGQYSNGTANLYAGIIRNATDKNFYFFKDYSVTPGNDIDTGDASFAVANVVAAFFQGNVVANSVLSDIVNAGTLNMTASINLTGDASGYKQNTTTIYGGDAGAGFGRIEYYANKWVFNAGSDSANIAFFQRGNLVKTYIDNDGNFSGIANNANNFGGQLPAYYTNATNISTGTLDTARLPATINATAINVGANLNLSTTQINIGNATVNTTISSTVVKLASNTLFVNATAVVVTLNDALTFADGTTQNTAFRVYDSAGTRIA